MGDEFSENCVIHSVKHGDGSINVSAVFRTPGAGPISHISGILDGNEDVEILDNVLLPCYREEFGGNYEGAIILQQHNDLKHNCRVAIVVSAQQDQTVEVACAKS